MDGINKRLRLVLKKLSAGWTLEMTIAGQYRIYHTGGYRREEVFISDSDFNFIKANYKLQQIGTNVWKLLK